jgi:hypothetical protein
LEGPSSPPASGDHVFGNEVGVSTDVVGKTSKDKRTEELSTNAKESNKENLVDTESSAKNAGFMLHTPLEHHQTPLTTDITATRRAMEEIQP